MSMYMITNVLLKNLNTGVHMQLSITIYTALLMC